MAAIPDKVLDCMRTNLNIHLENYLRLHPISLTHDEYLDLLANPEHHSILRDAAKYANIRAAERWVDCEVPVDGLGLSNNSVDLGFFARSEAKQDAPLIPRYVRWHGNVPAAPKVVEWLVWRIETGKKAALVNYLLCHFKEWDSGAKVRFVWPAIMQLCAPLNAAYTPNADKLENWAKRYSAYKAQQSVPALSQAVREALKITSEWLTACALLPKDMPEPPVGEVAVDIHGVNWFEFHGMRMLIR